MFRYIVRRLLALIPVWLVLSFVTFSMLHAIPGDPVITILGPSASPEARAKFIQQMGLDQPFLVQYKIWLSNVLRGDLGNSIFLGRTVTTAIRERLPVTMSVGVGALVVAMVLGLPAGIISGIKKGSRFDSFVRVASLAGVSTAEFVLGLGLIYLFSVKLEWLPVGGYVPLSRGVGEWLKHVILPCFTLGCIWAALVARMTRGTMVDILSSDYIRTARAKGLSEIVVHCKHALRVAIVPITTVLGFVVVLVVSGAFITEIVFTLPGMGNLMVNAVQRRDYPVVQGAMLFIGTGILLINLLVDIVYAYLDPRIKYD